jgi:hypothetical protein
MLPSEWRRQGTLHRRLIAKVDKLEAMVEKVNARQTTERNGANQVASTNE